MNRRSLNSVAVLLAALTVAGCAQSNGDLVQVQPNVVRKADLLDGVWYFRNTVTWTPFNTQFTYPGQTGNMEKLVWEIQQGYLVGYRSYPYVLGAEPNVDETSRVSGTTARYCDVDGKCAGGQKYYGSPVVAFPILSHFDIQRGYNPATGEQTNVISENTSDRPWNEREFIRVNWAANELNKTSGMNWGTVQNANDPDKVSNANWIQANEPGSDPFDWPTFEYTDRNGDGTKELTYFDVTGRYMANPDEEHYEFDDGTSIDVPLCYFAPGIYECASSEIHVRISVAKVDVAHSQNYEPLVYGNDLMAYFGFFRTERLNYDKKFGFTESARILLANRHRIYKEYYTTENGKVTDTPIPVAQRELKPVVYYFTPAARMGGQSRYDEFWEPGRKIEAEYDRAFRRAVAAARGATPADKANWQAQPQMFYLCNNPVKSGDPAACGTAGFAPKIGDLRYSFVNTVAEPVANGLLGYGPSAGDPETGEIISAMSNTYTWGVDLYGAEVKNWVLLQSGELSINDYISGQMVKDYISQNPAYNIRNRAGALQSELQGIATRNEESKGVFERPTARMQGVMNKMVADRNTIAANGTLQKAAEELKKHPELEATILDNPDVAGDVLNLLPPPLQAALANDPAHIREASRKILTDPTSMYNWEKRRIEWLSKNNITTFDFYDRTLVAYAATLLDQRVNAINELKAQGLSDDEAKRQADEGVMKSVRQNVWLATALHETGHTLNLRHNFQGSYDALNYHDDYWDIRGKSLSVEQGGVAKIARTPADMKTVAEGTQLDLLSGVHNGEYSSIMDYSGKIYGDWVGLGKYDEAAIIFAYSGDKEPGYVEVFDNARMLSQVFPGSDGANVTVSGAGADLPLVNVQHTNPNIRNYTERFHYSLAPLHFGEGAGVTAAMNDGIAKIKARHLAKWSDVVASETAVRNELIADPTLIDDPDRASGVIGNAVLRVPYMFCTDESADGPVLSCNRFDRGPDYYEMVHTKLEDYWNYYVDSHFRKDRISFSGSGAINGTFSTFNLAASSYRHWVYEYFKQAARDQEQGTHLKFDQNFQDYWTMAVLDGVNQNLNVMAVPQDGYYRLYPLTTGPTWILFTSGIDFDYPTQDGLERIKANYTGSDWVLVPRGIGRRMFNQYDYKSGYNYQRRINEAGHYNDQIGAMFAAILSEIEVQGVDVVADQNRYSIPYYLVFRDEMQSTFSAMWANDDAKIRPRIYRKALPTYPTGGPNNDGISDQPVIDYKTFVRGTDFFTGFNYPRELPNCTGPMPHPLQDDCLVGTQHAAPAFVFASSTAAFYSLYFGMAAFKVNFDLDYAKANQIFKLGSGESFTVAPGYEVVEVADIFTGHRYAAVKKTGSPKDSTGAERMINLTKDYLQLVENPATCPMPEYFQLLGYDCMDPAQANNPSKVEEERQYWKEAFQNQVGYLDLQRSFYNAFGKAL